MTKNRFKRRTIPYSVEEEIKKELRSGGSFLQLYSQFLQLCPQFLLFEMEGHFSR
jgi:hypothetical protein